MYMLIILEKMISLMIRCTDIVGRLMMLSTMPRSGDDCVETITVISGVVNFPYGTIRFHERVLPFDHIAITNFSL